MPGAYGSFGVGELHKGTDWSRSLAGCGAVVHLAGRVHVMADSGKAASALYRTVNVEATERLARMAAAAGVRRFVFISTVKVLGECSGDRALNDADAPATEDAYAISTFQAEQMLFEVASETGLEVVVLRPTLVYGPAVKANFLAMMEYLARGWPLPLGALTNKRTFCYLGNLNDAILTSLEHPHAPGRRFLVGDAETLILPAFIRLMGRTLGRSASLVPVPVSLLALAGSLLGKQAQLRRLLDSLEINISGIQNTLGWHPPWSIETGLEETARWFRGRDAK